MNSKEKFIMIAFPLLGLVLIYAFFDYHLTNQKEDVIINKPSFDISNVIPQKTINNKNSIHQDSNQNNTYRKSLKFNDNSDFIKWTSSEETKYIPQSVKNKRYNSSNEPAYTMPQVSYNTINTVKNKHSQLEKFKLIKQQKRITEAQCNYILKRKKQAEDRMKRGYKANQYNYLERDRKYWAKKYSDNCFNR